MTTVAQAGGNGAEPTVSSGRPGSLSAAGNRTGLNRVVLAHNPEVAGSVLPDGAMETARRAVGVAGASALPAGGAARTTEPGQRQSLLRSRTQPARN